MTSQILSKVRVGTVACYSPMLQHSWKTSLGFSFQFSLEIIFVLYLLKRFGIQADYMVSTKDLASWWSPLGILGVPSLCVYKHFKFYIALINLYHWLPFNLYLQSLSCPILVVSLLIHDSIIFRSCPALVQLLTLFVYVGMDLLTSHTWGHLFYLLRVFSLYFLTHMLAFLSPNVTCFRFMKLDSLF